MTATPRRRDGDSPLRHTLATLAIAGKAFAYGSFVSVSFAPRSNVVSRHDVHRVGEVQISDLGRLFGIAPHVLRHWEAVGVLTSPVRRHGRRFYHEPHVKRVAMIICAQKAGFGLRELREILDARTVSARKTMLEQHQATLARRMSDLAESQRIVQQMLDWPHENFSECPVFERALATIFRIPADVAHQSSRTSAIGHAMQRKGRRRRA